MSATTFEFEYESDVEADFDQATNCYNEVFDYDQLQEKDLIKYTCDYCDNTF
jgi:hypothetical protein